VFRPSASSAAAHAAPLPASFYELTGAEAKAMMAAQSARREEASQLRTQQQRDAEAARRRRTYRKALLRVRFPDGSILQASFAASVPVSRVLSWVSESLREPGHAFELGVARGQALAQPKQTLTEAQLVPAALLNFRVSASEGFEPPFLLRGLLEQAQDLASEELPQGQGGIQPDGKVARTGAPRVNQNESRVPKWAPKS
jgi:hypothetical protein